MPPQHILAQPLIESHLQWWLDHPSLEVSPSYYRMFMHTRPDKFC